MDGEGKLENLHFKDAFNHQIPQYPGFILCFRAPISMNMNPVHTKMNKLEYINGRSL